MLTRGHERRREQDNPGPTELPTDADTNLGRVRGRGQPARRVAGGYDCRASRQAAAILTRIDENMTNTNRCWSSPAASWAERLMVLSTALFVGCAAPAPSRCPYGVAVSSSFDQVHTCDDTGLIGTGLLSGDASQVGSACGLFPDGVWRSISTADGPRTLCLPAALTAPTTSPVIRARRPRHRALVGSMPSSG